MHLSERGRFLLLILWLLVRQQVLPQIRLPSEQLAAPLAREPASV